MRDIGVFCGTFNPIHWGHLMLAEFARDQFKLEKVFVVTSANPPHRNDKLLDAEIRHRLVMAACKSNPHFEPSRIELDRNGPSYTADTLRQIRVSEENGGTDELRINFLIGQDNLPHLKEWHDADELFKICRFLIATRHSTVTRDEVLNEVPPGTEFELIDFPRVPVSGTLVRARRAEKKTIMYLVSPPVQKIIVEENLYCS